ncbi:MAG: transcription termination/antitermination factor NusG [Prevotellaceae bacterium]|nr:transcription termination/antitermination factor NusG [Candidatus Faecinaster equi]
MANTSLNWYVLRAISGKEVEVKEYVEAGINNGTLAPFVKQALVPMEKYYQVKNGKRVLRDRKFFTGYVLVQAIMDGDIPHLLRHIPNVMGILGGLDNPTPIHQSEVNRILGAVDDQMENLEENVSYIVGESVKVIEGPFNGFIGTIEDVNDEKKKLTVMVKVFGRNTPLVLSFMQVEKSLG